MNFKVIIHQDADGIFCATCPELPGCHTFGNTLEQAQTSIRDAIRLYVDDASPERLERLRKQVTVVDIEI